MILGSWDDLSVSVRVTDNLNSLLGTAVSVLRVQYTVNVPEMYSPLSRTGGPLRQQAAPLRFLLLAYPNQIAIARVRPWPWGENSLGPG